MIYPLNGRLFQPIHCRGLLAMPVPIVGIDLSKSVFQLSVANSKHHVINRKRLSRAQFHRYLAQTRPVRLVIEACGTSNYWGRTAQSHDHAVKLLHARYVKAYVRRTKIDYALEVMKDVIKAIVEMKQRNPRYGCPRIAQQINYAECSTKPLLDTRGLCGSAPKMISCFSTIDGQPIF